jgi:eukaryotic-like serine/threonine-protein kinase
MLEALGHYKILEPAGSGAIGEAYRARDLKLGRTVAIEIVPPEIAADPGRRERFLADASAGLRLSHQNIAALYEVGNDQGHLFVASEFVPGETLRTVLGGRPLNARRAVDLAIQLADALAEAHAESIVDGALHPDAVIVTPKGSAKILGVGLSAWVQPRLRIPGVAATAPAAPRRPAHPQEPVSAPRHATPEALAYVSPEQALGRGADHRTDIYSLGAVLFEMLTGRVPFTASDSATLMLQIAQSPAPLPSSLNASLPRDLDPILKKALAKNADERYEAAATLAAELRAVAAVLATRAAAAEPVSVSREAPRSGRSSRWWIALLLLALATAAVWFVFVLSQ